MFWLITYNYIECLKINYVKSEIIVLTCYPEESPGIAYNFADRFRLKNKHIAASIDFVKTMSLTD